MPLEGLVVRFGAGAGSSSSHKKEQGSCDLAPPGTIGQGGVDPKGLVGEVEVAAMSDMPPDERQVSF